jgi:hypothetical protein
MQVAGPNGLLHRTRQQAGLTKFSSAEGNGVGCCSKVFVRIRFAERRMLAGTITTRTREDCLVVYRLKKGLTCGRAPVRIARPNRRGHSALVNEKKAGKKNGLCLRNEFRRTVGIFGKMVITNRAVGIFFHMRNPGVYQPGRCRGVRVEKPRSRNKQKHCQQTGSNDLLRYRVLFFHGTKIEKEFVLQQGCKTVGLPHGISGARAPCSDRRLQPQAKKRNPPGSVLKIKLLSQQNLSELFQARDFINERLASYKAVLKRSFVKHHVQKRKRCKLPASTHIPPPPFIKRIVLVKDRCL